MKPTRATTLGISPPRPLTDEEYERHARALDRRIAPVLDRILARMGTTWEEFRLTLPPMADECDEPPAEGTGGK